MTREVYITRTASVLPGEPVDNASMERLLGQVGPRPSRARAMVLRSNGIRSRHYAIDPATGEPTHTNAKLAADAVRALGDIGMVDCLGAATSTPDQLVPGHGVMVHGELGWPWLEVVSTAGICLSGVAALKYGWMSVRAGETTQAVTVASELVSSHLRAPLFEPELDERVRQLEARPEIAFEKDFLRWMLSDGAGAVLLSSEPGRGLSLRLDWITMSSAAQELPACMYGGAHRRDDGSLVPWHFLPPSRWLAESTFTVRQDVRLLDEHVVRATLVEPLQRLRARRPVRAEAIDWFLPHISSMYFAERVVRGLEEAGLPIPRERWFSNLVSRGNTGSASPFIMLDELLRSGRVEPGQRLLMFVPESGRFSSGFVHLTAVQGRGDAL